MTAASLERDRGLVQKVGALGLGVAVFNTVVGAGIFVLPAALAREVGPAAPLAYLACVIAMGGVVVCFAEAGSRVPTSGGPYGYTEAAFGRFVGFVVGVLLWLSCVLASAGIAAAIADSLARFFPVLANPVTRAVLIVTMFAVFALINIAGVAPGTRLVGVMTVAKLLPLALLLAVGVLHIHPHNLVFRPPAASSFGRAMILAIFAFQGMEGALGVSGEVQRPARNIPLGLFGAMLSIAVLYVAIQLVTQGVLGPALAQSKAPLADALAGVSPVLAGVLIVGAAISMFGYLASDTLSAPRLLFAFARDGFLPRRLEALHPRTHAPYAAILLHVGVAAALALSGGFIELAVLSSLATVGVYIVSCVAAVRLKRRGVALAGPPLGWRGTSVAALVGVVGMVWIAAHATVQEAIGSVAAIGLIALWFYAAERLARGRAA